MQVVRIQFFCLLMLAVILAGCGGGVVREGPFTGRVLDVRDEGSVRLESRGRWFSTSRIVEADIYAGDVLWLQSGLTVRGDLVGKFPAFEFKRIWPASPGEDRQLHEKNRLLRRDTVNRGMSAFREVGEGIPEFALYDQDGKLISRADFEGRRTVVNFIFSRCTMPEMCPAATQRMGLLLSKLKSEEFQDVRLVSITMDPEFDTPGILKAYARSYDLDGPRFRFLTGPLQTVQDLKKQLGILSKPDQALVIKHTMRTILIGPDLKIVYHTPGSMWGVEDFLEKIHDLPQNKPL